MLAALGALSVAGGAWFGRQKPPALQQIHETTGEDQVTKLLTELFPDAPQNVLEIARIIDEGGLPPQGLITELTDADLNRSWSEITKPKLLYRRFHSLLRHAVEARNVEAAQALITAGADLFYNQNEMPFAAMAMEDRPDFNLYWFPDYQRGNALLRLWLASGGRVDALYPGDSWHSMLLAAPTNNLDALFTLLEAGADPWHQPVGAQFEDGTVYLSDSFHMRNANANPESNEVAFRVALLGYYRGGEPAQIDELLFLYDRTAAQYIGTTGPDSLHSVWCMKKVLPLILDQTDRKATGHIAELLAMQVPDDIGGFWLGPDEIRSPMIPEQLVRNDNQFGYKKWDSH